MLVLVTYAERDYVVHWAVDLIIFWLDLQYNLLKWQSSCITYIHGKFKWNIHYCTVYLHNKVPMGHIRRDGTLPHYDDTLAENNFNPETIFLQILKKQVYTELRHHWKGLERDSSCLMCCISIAYVLITQLLDWADGYFMGWQWFRLFWLLFHEICTGKRKSSRSLTARELWIIEITFLITQKGPTCFSPPGPDSIYYVHAQFDKIPGRLELCNQV